MNKDNYKTIGTIHKSTLKHTSKGLRIWCESADFLNGAGFTCGSRYDREYKESGIKMTLNPNGKYRVSNGSRNGKARPIIDIVGKAIAKSIDPTCETITMFDLSNGSISIMGDK